MKKNIPARRGELLSEIFLQELNPVFVAKSPVHDLFFDYFVGFSNPAGGVNILGVEVKSTERPVKDTFVLSAKVFDFVANSNIPVVLLVVDVKLNEFFYGWIDGLTGLSRLKGDVRVPMIRADEGAKRRLVDRMSKNLAK